MALARGSDADTVFRLASLSKPIGTTVVAHQVGTGSVSCDTPVRSNLRRIALLMLMSTQN
ncbi:serine hydrolase [Paraburkholderia hospita]|jgi:CubicO group peptidase (beta-lactamase class C family)|uniref:serine hydrolase n=1 Tax=Paraburkholderia hospita TaxID=169430 RepID=UPI003ECCAC37